MRLVVAQARPSLGVGLKYQLLERK